MMGEHFSSKGKVKMKLSDYVVEYLEKANIDTVFGYQGSSVAHTIDSLTKNHKITYVQTLHEQAAAFAANGYALSGNRIGAALACSGPGAINLMNGIANAYYDSVPCIFITGQVSLSGIRDEKSKIRQLGFQETDIVSLVKPITKYAVTIKKAEDIAYHLEKAFFFMLNERPGPVLIDIPHNIQASSIEPQILKHFEPETEKKMDVILEMEKSVCELKNSKRPMILVGGGARGLRGNFEFETFLKNSNIPVVSSYLGKDVVDNQLNNYIGVIGAYGNRYANWAVKYSDLLLVVGSRVDGRQTGDDMDFFASDAKVIYVDVDCCESEAKPERYIKINTTVETYISFLCEKSRGFQLDEAWLMIINKWKKKYKHWEEFTVLENVNPNKFIYDLTQEITGKFVLTTDVGQNQIWTNASAYIKSGCCLIQSGGLGSMGFSLPSAIGAFYANPEKQIICICGDGGIQMNIQELGTVALKQIPIKIIVFNNQSLGLIRVYQEKALGSNFEGSVYGFSSPDYGILAKAYGIKYLKISSNDYQYKIDYIMGITVPILVEVCVSNQSTNFPEPTYQSTIDNQSIVIEEQDKERIRQDVYEREEI